jgi:hypothetical protein
MLTAAMASKAIRVLAIPLLATTLIAIPGARADTIYKCRTASGAMSYSANPCRSDAVTEKQIDYTPARESKEMPAAKAGMEKGSSPVAAEKQGSQDSWPPKEDMHEARARAAAEEERAAAEKARQAEEFKKSHTCVYLRQRAALGDRRINMLTVESMGCM